MGVKLHPPADVFVQQAGRLGCSFTPPLLHATQNPQPGVTTRRAWLQPRPTMSSGWRRCGLSGKRSG